MKRMPKIQVKLHTTSTDLQFENLCNVSERTAQPIRSNANTYSSWLVQLAFKHY